MPETIGQSPQEARVIERSYHIAKLTLLEVMPLYPFLSGRDRLRVIEVGANTGLWCEAFDDVYGHRVASYTALEPMPGNVARLRQRLTDHLPGNRVTVLEACAGDAAGEVELHFDREVTTLASVAVAHLDDAQGRRMFDLASSRVVPQVRLDDLIGPDEHVDMIKIDTEGYEWQVLEGLSGSIDAGRVDNVFLEFGRHQGHLGQTFEQFFDFFHARGWRVYRQMVGRNYFGLNHISRYHPRFEEEMTSSMCMVLGSRLGPDPDYRGPRLTGAIN